MSKGSNVPGAPFLIPVLIFAFFLALAIPAVALAEERTFTLADAVNFALQNNNELRAAESSVAAQKDDVGIARSGLLPKVFFEERYLRTNNPTYAFMAKLNQGQFTQQDFAIDNLNHPSPIDDYLTLFGVEQPLFHPKAWLGLDISKREHEAGSVQLARKKEEIAFKVCQAWLMVHTARAQLTVAEKGVKDAQEHYRMAKLRYESDLGMYADTLRQALPPPRRGSAGSQPRSSTILPGAFSGCCWALQARPE